MKTAELIEAVEERFPEGVASSHAYRGDATVVLRADALVDVAGFLREEPALAREMLSELTAVDWSGLSRANLTRADLFGADLSGANLWQANLKGASLASADLTEADLEDASLEGADLSGADLSGAKLFLVNLSAVSYTHLTLPTKP